MSEYMVSGKLPILALRGLAVFPDQTVHFDVGRPKSIRALEAAMKGEQSILLIPQRDLMVDDPGLEDLFTIGVVAKVKQVLKTHGDNLRVLVTGLCRARIASLDQTEPYLSGMVCSVPETEQQDSTRSVALRREANAIYSKYAEVSEFPGQTILMRLSKSESNGFTADTIAQNCGIDYTEKGKLLCQMNPTRRLESIIKLLRKEVEVLKLEAQIQERTKANMDQNQKDYYLREQIRAIREELGEGDDDSEFENYIARIRLNCSSLSATALRKRAAGAPSTTRWSKVRDNPIA